MHLGIPAPVRSAPDGPNFFVHADGSIRVIAWVLVFVAVALFWAAALYGINSPFYYGHFGYHGGSYATWARGTLRHHTLLPVNEPGFLPPRPGSYYIHHPILTHQLVTLTFALFGEHEWSVRLGALIPSFISLLLVTAIAWRHIGPLAGAAAALMFAIVPVNIWYSVNIDQGFPSIACLLAFFWFYLRWLRSGRWSAAAAALAFEALAGGFEWSPYFAFPAIFAHVAWTAHRKRGRYLTFALLHPIAAVVVPLGGHFLTVWKAGMMGDLLGAYRTRAAEVGYRSFLRTMQQYGETLFGRVLLAVMFLWVGWTLIRVARGRGRAVDLVGLTFAFALIAYVHVFKNAVITHAYRQLYGNVWAALAVADLTAAAATWAGWARRVANPSAGPAARANRAGVWTGFVVWALVASLVLAATAPVAWAGLIESRAHGGIPGWTVFNPDLRQTAFAREVNRATRPGDVLYFNPTFPSPPPSRMDWAFYYDRDLSRGALLRTLQALPASARARAVAILIPANVGMDERRAYAELARKHTIVMVGELTMLDLRSTRAEIRAFSVVPMAVPAGSEGGSLRNRWGRWLQGPYPLPRLVPDPQRQAAEEQMLQATLATPPPKPPAPMRGAMPTRTPPSLEPAAAAKRQQQQKKNKQRRRLRQTR